jgi:tricorn protease
MRGFKIIVGILILGFILLSSAFAEEGRLMRFPDIHKDKIVFVYAGDLWLVSSQGGIARRLTTHEGLELIPKFSPDGKWIAFTGQYDGNTDVYIIPSEGGEPKRLTFYPGFENTSERHGFDDMVLGWHPDNQRVLFKSWRDSYNGWFQRLFLIDKDGGFPEVLPLPEGGLTCFSPDGDKIAYNRIFRNFRTWKRYKGGLAQDIWIYDLKKNEVEKVTNYQGTDTYPMWHQDRIYFGSDRDHTMNIFSYDLKTKEIRKITNHQEFDVNWPSLGPEAIVYENGGYLYVLDLATENAQKITVRIPDDAVLARPEIESVSEYITDFSLSPDAKRALMVARGDVFTVPEKKGNTRNLSNSSSSKEKNAVWSPDGKWIAYISDKSGEEELYIIPQGGKGKEIRVTNDGHAYRFPPVWSPDSKKLLYADNDYKLFYVDIETKKINLIDSSLVWRIEEYSWSPDSKWVTYIKLADNRMNSVFLYSLEKDKIFRVTRDFTDDREPIFDPEGKYLYFLSRRDFNAAIGRMDFNFTYNEMTRIYVATLQAEAPSPLAPESDEVELKAEKEEKKETPERKEKETTVIKIDIEGIGDRVVALPTDPGNYTKLRAAKGKILYLSQPTRTLTGEKPKKTLHLFDMEERKEHELLSKIDDYDLSADGKKIIYKNGKKYGIIEAKPGSHKVGDGELNLAQMEMKIDRKKEWEQIFNEVWRWQRDFFYDRNMHGVDWKLMRTRYGELLPYVTHRFDLTYVLSEMISELCCSHAYIGGGDKPKVNLVETGLLGVDFEPDTDAGFYKIKKILTGENWKENLRSPLTEPGVQVKEGEYLIAVNDQLLQYPQSPYAPFENTVGKTVTLKVDSKPSLDGAREVEVKPIKSEYNLRELEWVKTNREKVEKATDGKVGYIFLPDMGGGGLNEFAKSFFAQVDKEGLIIDVRYNGGGFVSQMILERLRRIIKGMAASRGPMNWTYPDRVFHGHMVCLNNSYSASDGDYFSYYFREYGLGTIVGQRTWGGAVGFDDVGRLVDKGYIIAPQTAPFGLEGEWIMENYGVDPDIEIDNRPDLVVQGRDPQLEKAIEIVMKKIEQEPKELPERPAYPIKK